MKKFIFPAIIIVLLYLTGLFTSCKDSDNYNYFLVKVDSVLLPDEIFVNQPFEAQFSGTIGHNGCYGFERFITEWQDSILYVEAWGKLRTNSSICPDAMVGLNREKLKLLIKNEGIYTLRIKQPGGTFQEQKIEVR